MKPKTLSEYSKIQKKVSKILHGYKLKLTDKEINILISKRNPEECYRLCRAIKKPLEKVENIITKSLSQTFYYLLHFHEKLPKERKEKLENVIAKNKKYSFDYAQDLGERFVKGEDSIAKCPHYSVMYALDVIKGRFIKGEDSIAKNAQESLYYATNVLFGRFEKGEEALKKKKELWQEYNEIIKDITIQNKLKNKSRIKDKKLESEILDHYDYCTTYKNNIKTLILENIDNGNYILSEFSDLPFFSDIIASISKKELLPEEVNNFMIAKGLIDAKMSKKYLEQRKIITNKIKRFLENHKGKTVDELLLNFQ